jgi:Uma2 family endonuclease
VSLTITKGVTADELLAMPDDGYRYELVKGELIRMSPTGHEHGFILMNLASPLYQYVKTNGLGVVTAADTGFVLERSPDTVLAPDISFLSSSKFSAAGPTAGFWEGAPDLAVEVTSPSDRPKQVELKAKKWLASGTKLVWVINPKLRNVTVYRAPSNVTILSETDVLKGDDVVPGFQIKVAEIFRIEMMQGEE